MEQPKKQLPKLAELYSENLERFTRSDALNFLCSQEPKKEWVKKHPYIKDHNYIPIGVVETLLLKIFKEIKIEVLQVGTMFNAVYCHVRLHYLDMTTGEWRFHDGVGACQLQTKQGSSPADLQNINNGAVTMALPIAKSFAIKDAAEHIGKLFGRDLNRKDVMEYVPEKSLNIDKRNDDVEYTRTVEYINAQDEPENLIILKDTLVNSKFYEQYLELIEKKLNQIK